MFFKNIFVYDVDGTIFTNNNTVHPLTQEMILKAKKEGHLNVVATGRGIKKILPLIDNETIKGIDFLVCSNGALIYDLNNQKTIILGSLPPEIYDPIEKFAVDNELILTVDTDKFNGSWIPSTQGSDFPYWITEAQIMDMDIVNRCSRQELRNKVYENDAAIMQIALRNPKMQAVDNTSKVKEFVGSDYEVYLTNSIYTDVNPLGISKYSAIQKIVKEQKIWKRKLIVFGDSANDKEMIQNANYGFAMDNATLEAKEVAKEIIGDNNSGTIGETLKRFLKKW